MKKTVSIIGGGAAAMTVAAFLDTQQFDVTIYEKNKAMGRKFLVAGKGGFNLTHSEPIEVLIERYTPSSFLKAPLTHFDNDALRAWLETIGIPTYVGSSKRIYPKEGIKPIEVFKAIQNVLIEKGVNIVYNHNWTGWDAKNNLEFNESETTASDITIFAMGGGSWKVTGSDGSWLPLLEAKGIEVLPFQASNCAFQIEWSKEFLLHHAGDPLKNIAISSADLPAGQAGIKQKGEAVITDFGLEGNAIYALSPQIRSQLKEQGEARITIDLKPTLPIEVILAKLKKPQDKRVTQLLKKELKLSPVQIGLLKAYVSKEDFLNLDTLAQNIKALQLTIVSVAPIDEAISTVGGIALTEVDEHFQLKNLAHHYCIGELLDWDAPTGGYLLQACFSMGVALATYLNTENA